MAKSFKDILKKGVGSLIGLPGLGTLNTLDKFIKPVAKSIYRATTTPKANSIKPVQPAPVKKLSNTIKGPAQPRPSSNPFGSSVYRASSTAVSRPNSLAKAIASGVRVPTKTYSLKDVFSSDEQALARQSIAQRVARLINPELERGNESINTDFSNRGLFRSGLRDRGLSEFSADIEDKRQTQQEELYNIRLAEAYDALQRKQKEAERQAELLNKRINFSQYI